MGNLNNLKLFGTNKPKEQDYRYIYLILAKMTNLHFGTNQLFPLLKYDKHIITCHFSYHTLYQPCIGNLVYIEHENYCFNIQIQ
jgi:hypothetical protein